MKMIAQLPPLPQNSNIPGLRLSPGRLPSLPPGLQETPSPRQGLGGWATRQAHQNSNPFPVAEGRSHHRPGPLGLRGWRRVVCAGESLGLLLNGLGRGTPFSCCEGGSTQAQLLSSLLTPSSSPPLNRDRQSLASV